MKTRSAPPPAARRILAALSWEIGSRFYLRKNILLWLISYALLTGAASAQVNVTATAGTTGPTSYTTLKAAFDAVNAGTHTGTISIGISADTDEGTETATLNASASGSASYTSITISPSGGAARTITGAAVAGSPLIDFNGADNVTIDGLNTGGNSLTISNTTASATAGTSTLRFIGGATNNTITKCSLQGSVSSSTNTNGAVVFFSTDATTTDGNDNNTISNNNIGPAGANLPTKAIQGNGSTTTTAKGNSGILIHNNNIFDYFGATVTSSGVVTNGGCNTWTITDNRFYQTATRTWTSGATHRAIDIGNNSATSGAQGFTITGNTIGYASSTQTGTYTLTGSTGKFQGIVYSGIPGAAVTNINSNTVAAVSLTGVTSSSTATTSPFLAILVQNGPANTNSNTIGSQSATASLVFSTTTTSSTDVIGISNHSTDDWTSNSNTVGGISVTNAGASGTFIVYGMRASTSTAKVWNATSNLVGGTIANSIQLSATGTSSQVIGMNANIAAAALTSNTVRNLTTNIGTGTTTGASVIGIYVTTSTPNHTLSQNTIFNLTNTHATAASVVTGIQFTGATANVVERNSISRLSVATNSATAEVNGIRVAGGTTVYRNNMIAIGASIANAIGAAATNTSTTGINGIYEAGGTNSIFHNSVYIGGSPTAGTGASYAFNNGAALTATRSIRNNIFFNARSNSGATGKHYAIKLNGTTANPTGLTINNNLYFANGTGAVFGFFNSLDVATLAAWATAVGQDARSFESNPQFNDPANATPDLHLHPTNLTVAEGNGTDVGVTNDFDGQTRAGLTPVDIGADAGSFTFGDLSPPEIAFTALSNTTLTGDRTLTATITDVTGVATGAVAPRIYYRKNAGAYFSQAGSLTSGTVQNGAWSFTIAAADLGGLVLGDVVSCFVVAQDTLGNLASNPSAGFVGTNVNTVTTPPTTPNQATIVPAISGVLNVGPTETITSLTNAGGIFEAINAGALTGNVTVNLTGDLLAETGTVALNQWGEDGVGGYTLLIKPGGAPRSIVGTNTGALIRLNGADRVTFDGSTTGGTATGVGGNAALRELTIQNTNVGTSAVVMSFGSGSNGAQNNTIRNVNVIGQDPTTSLAGISLGGNTPGTAGTDNDNNRVENCSVKRVIFGIYSSGASAANPNTGTVITMNETSAITGDRIRRVGIMVFNDNGVQITANSINGISTNESADAIGIALGIQGIDTTITTAGGVTNALVSRNKISGIASLSPTGFSAAGITVAGATGGANTIVNNTITGVTAPSTSPDIVAGIFVVGASGSSTRLYHNSIAMTGDRGAVAAQMPSFGVAITGADPTVELKNNIIYTTQTASGGGVNAKSYAIGMVTTTFANLDSNYNDFYVEGVNAGFFRSGSLAVAAGTDYATLAAWQAAVSDDANSQEVDPVFVDPLIDLHLTLATTPLLGDGITGFATVDIDGDSRSTPPNIGADDQVQPPTLTSLSPTSGSTAGGTSVVLTGTGFGGATSVTFGGTAATSFTVDSVTQITAVIPAHAAGAVSVLVTTSGGTNAANTLFTYAAPTPTVTSISPSSGSTAGGTSVTITGTNFATPASVTIGGTAATSVTVVNATTITATTPAGTGTAKDVVVTVSGMPSTGGTGLFSYEAPTVASITPNFGSTAGGTSVTITGTNFGGTPSVTIGGNAATDVVVTNATTLTATTPAGTAGARDVVVTVSGQTSTGGTGLYTYTTPGPLAALEAYLKTGNSGSGDQFGYSVAVSGDTAVIGAPFEDSNAASVDGDGTNNSAVTSGAAYVFTRSGGTWTQQAYLKAGNAESGDAFGYSVAVSGDTIVIGAPYEASNANSVDGDDKDNSATASGAAYVFTRSGGAWSPQAYLKASNSGEDDEFGMSVAVSGDTVVVGAHYEASNANTVNGDGTNNSAPNSGAAYVFTRRGGNWSQQAYLKAGNSGEDDEFGVSVAVSGDTALIGAFGEDSNASGVGGDGADNSATYSGAAYVFTRSGGVWSQQAYLKASNSEANDFFGWSVALSGDTALIGAYGESSNATTIGGDGTNNSALYSGAAYIFTRSASTWSQQAYLKASSAEADDNFGWSVALSGDTAVVGAYSEDSSATGIGGDGSDNSSFNAGAAYVFTRSASTWSQQAYLKADNSGEDDQFGFSVAVSGDTAAVGAIRESSNATTIGGDGSNNTAFASGAAYIFSGLGPAVAAPTVTNVAPAIGSIDGGTPVLITGTGFTGATAVTFDGFAAAPFTVVDASTITTTTPAHAAGAVSVEVTTPIGMNAANTLYTYVVPVPEIDIKGNGVEITSGDTTPAEADGTDFGYVTEAGSGVETRIFTVTNLGLADLSFEGIPLVEILGGAEAQDFSVVAMPNSPLAPLDVSTFEIEFNPTAPGLRRATVRVQSDDADEGSYTFDIQGRGVTYASHFTGNSGTVPTDWTDISFDAAPVIGESGTTVSIKDNRGNGGPSFIKSTSQGGMSAFTLRVDIASMSATLGKQAEAMTAVGDAGVSMTLLLRFNSTSGTFSVSVLGAPANLLTLPWSISGYAGGALSYVLTADSDSFRVTCPAYSYDSGDTLFTAIGAAGFSSLSDLGSTVPVILGTECAGSGFGTATVVYDRVVVDATSAGAAAPTVTGVSPSTGPTTGGTAVTITGTGFTGATGVTIGGAAAPITAITATEITATTPPHAAGAVSVEVTTPVGANAANMLFTYTSAAVAGGVLNVTPGTGSTNDRLTLSLVDGKIRITDPNNALFAGAGGTQVDENTIEFPLAGLTGLTFDGSDGDDVFTVDLSGGNPLPDDLTFNGGGGDDALRVVGNGQVVVYTPDAVTNGNGSILAGGKTISFTGLEPIDFVGVAFTLSLPGANDIVDVANGFLIDGTTPAVMITGTSGGIGFENARVRSSSIVIDTTGVAGTDAITVTSADNLHLNTSLTVTTGTEAGDTITVNGTTTVTGATTLNAKTIALNANVTNAVTGTVATVVNVDDPGQIADGVAVAVAGATVNVAAGTHTLTAAIPVNKQLTLRGAQFGVDARTRGVVSETVVDASGLSGFPSTTFAVQAGISGVIIDGFTIQGAQGGQGVGGIYLAVGSNGTTIQNNILQNNSAGVYVANNSGVNQTVIQKNLFRNNTAAGAGSGHGIYADQFTAGAGLQNVLIDSNVFTNTAVTVDSWGLGISNTSPTPFTNITFSNNEITNHGRGVYFYNTDSSVITGNTISGVTNYALGLFDGSDAVSITGNRLENGTRGIWFGADLGNANTNITVSSNALLNNSLINLLYDAGSYTGTSNASANYFGSGDPAAVDLTINDTAVSPVDFTPLLANNESVANQSVPGFQADLSALIVHTVADQTGGASRIQEGVDVVDSTGTVNVLSGSYAGNVSTAAKTVTLAAGASPGQVVVNGSFTLDGNDTLPVEINGLTAGSGYDQWVVNGAVTLGGATLSLSGSHTPVVLNQSFTIVDNDLADAVTGTFAGLAEGALISNFLGSAFSAKVSYVGGDGNDVTLKAVTPEIVVHDGATIADPELTDGQVAVVDFGTTTQGGGSARSFTIRNTGEVTLAVSSITAPAGFSVAGAPATVAPGANATFTVTLTAASTGTFSGNVVINSNDLDEAAFDFPVTGVVNPQVVVTGGSPNAVVNVELGSLTGFTVTVRTPTPAITTYTLTRGAGSGNWLGTDVAGVVTGFGTTALNIIKAGVTTVNITDSNGANSVTFEGRAATTDATRIYEDNFTVMLNGALAGGVVFSGNNEFTGSASLTVAARGVAVGNVINVQANTTLQSVDGDITLSGNYFLADASSGGGTIHGITQQGTIRTTGSGDIVLNGRGGSGFAGSSIGINAASGAKLLVEGTGTVTLTGIGGPGNGLSSQVGCKGIRLVGAEVSSAAGAISMTGTSAALAGTQHSGIMVSGTIIQGTAPLVPVSISLNGTGASATDSVNSARSLHGVEITGASSIRTVKGSISIVGVAGTLPALSLGDTNYGVLIQDTAEVTSTGDATISIDGTGSIGGDDSMHGFLMTGTAPGSKVSVADGDLTITGTTGGSNDASSISHNGVLISNANLLIASTGSGNVSITGKRAAGTASAVSIGFQTQGAAAGSFQATGSGSITINADSMTLLGSNVIATSTSDITLRPHTAGLAVNLGAADSATQLGLTDTELDQVNAGTGRLIIGGASTGVITQSTAISRAALTNVVLSSGSASIPAINLSNGALTSTNGNVTLIGDAIAINVATGSIAAGTGTVALQPQTAATLIDLGGLDVAGTLGLTDGELDKVSAAALTVGSATSGAISTSAALSRTSATGISLVSAATITLSELIDTNGGNVSLTPGTSVLPTGTGTDLSMAASGTVSFSAGADLAISIEGNTANDEGSGYRQLSVVGGVNLTGSDLVLSGSYVPAPDDAFVIIANDGTDPVTGTFTSLTENTALVFNGRALAITYTGGDGNDVVLRRLKPTVTTLAALPVKALKATLRANVNANGFETTPINFELGTETGVYTSTHAAVPFTLTGGVTTLVSKLVLNLNQQTTYYYRTVATNEVGTTYGNEVSFTTPEAVPELYELVFAGGAGSTGSQVPGAPVGTTYQTFFGSPAIGSASTFAVRGQIKRPDTQIQHALFLGTGPDLFLRGQDTLFGPGDAVPAALPGGTYLNFFDPVLNADNRIAFLANVGGAAYVSGPRAVFTNIPDGTMKVIARQNATMGGFTFGIPSTVSVAGEGVLFLDSGGTRLFGWEPDQGTQLLFETGQSVGGKTVQAFEFVVGTGFASAQGRAHVLDSVSGNQKIALAVSFTDGSKGVVTGSIAPDGTVSGFDSSLVSTGEEINKFNTGAPIVQGATWSNSLFQKAGWDQTGKWFGFQAFLQSGTYPGGLVNSYNNSGLFIEVAPGETILQVREGEQAAGASAGVTYKDFYELSLGDNPAQYAFYADLRGPGVTSANMTGLWYKDSVGLKLAARTGSAAHGVVGGTFKTLNLFGQPAQSRLGLIASLNGPGVNATNDLGYWGVNSLGEVKLGLREGQSFVTSAGSRTVSTFTMLNAGVGSNGASRGFTANGFFTALIAFTDGSQIIVEIEVP